MLPGMFDDLAMLTSKALGREAQRELYGVDRDGPIAPGFDQMDYKRLWGVEVGAFMKRHYNKHAASLGLPVVIDAETVMEKGSRKLMFRLRFMGGFEIAYALADPRDEGLHAGIILHRLIRRADRQKHATSNATARGQILDAEARCRWPSFIEL
jgi:hypothetical protein